MGRAHTALGVLIGALVFAATRENPPAQPHFVRVADGLQQLTQRWRVVPLLPAVPVSVFLIAHEGKYALVDAGLPDSPRQQHASQLLEALRSALPEGAKVDAIFLTHTHPDHVGALPLLLEAFPDAPVLVHEYEANMLNGEAHWVPPGGFASRFAHWVGALPAEPVQVPKGRLAVLEEPLFELSAWGFPELVYVISFGHTPGHLSLLHVPTRTFIAGDAVTFLRPTLALANATRDADDTRVVRTFKSPIAALPGLTLRAAPHVLCLTGCDRETVTITSCTLTSALPFDRLIASHDYAPAGERGGWTPAEMEAWVATRSACQKALAAVSQGVEDEEGADVGKADEFEIAGEEGEEDDEYADSAEEEEL